MTASLRVRIAHYLKSLYLSYQPHIIKYKKSINNKLSTVKNITVIDMDTAWLALLLFAGRKSVSEK